MQAKNKSSGVHLLSSDDPIDSVWAALEWCYKPSESSKREPDLRGDPRRHFAIDNWRWGDWEEIFPAQPHGFSSIAPRSPTVLESVFSKFTRTTGNAFRFTKWKTKKRVLFHSLCVVFCRSLPQLCLSVPAKIYWMGVKMPIRCWRSKQIHDEYLVSVSWTGKMEKPVKNSIWIFLSSLIVQLIFLGLKLCVFLTPRAHSLYSVLYFTVNFACLHQFPSPHNFLHHRRTLNLNPSGSFLAPPTPKRKGVPLNLRISNRHGVNLRPVGQGFA